MGKEKSKVILPVKVDTTSLVEAIEKCKRIKKLLEEAQSLADELSFQGISLEVKINSKERS